MLMTRSQLENHIRICLGGTLAEEIIYQDDISTGATSDLEKANGIARRMVTEFGMSRLGRIFVSDGQASQFLGVSLREGDHAYSEETAREIDMEVRRLIDHATTQVRSLLCERRQALEALARRLVEKEVIEGAELDLLLQSHARENAAVGPAPSGNGEEPH